MEEKYSLTVFTPTYNRSHTLRRTYESLCAQSNKDFEWIVIDDGSTDGTKEMVSIWITEGRIPIRYFYKSNGGLHTGYNEALRHIDSELNVCIDSDDFMPPDGVEIILKTWKKMKSESLAGIIGLDYIASSNLPIGGEFSRENITCHFLEIKRKLRHKGDVKMVLRTDLLKSLIPIPSFQGEKNFNPVYLYLLIDPSLEYFIINKNLCNVDYQQGGMSDSIIRQFLNSPKSFAEIRKARMNHPRARIARKIIDSGHLVSSALLARDHTVLKGRYKKLYLLTGLPLGILFYCFLKFKERKFKENFNVNRSDL